MTEFTVRGSLTARDGWQSFERTIEAPNEDVAREHTYATFGSEHGLDRTGIDIDAVEEGAA